MGHASDKSSARAAALSQHPFRASMRLVLWIYSGPVLRRRQPRAAHQCRHTGAHGALRRGRRLPASQCVIVRSRAISATICSAVARHDGAVGAIPCGAPAPAESIPSARATMVAAACRCKADEREARVRAGEDFA